MRLGHFIPCLISSTVALASAAAPAWGASPAGPVSPFSEGTLEEALGRAKESGRWVLVDLTATWCGPCHEMDAEVWPREEVVRALSSEFVLLQRDGEKGEGEKIVARHHVVGYPTLLVLDATGNEVDRLMGFVGAKELVATLHERRAGRGTVVELERKLAAASANANAGAGAAAADEALRLEVGTRHAMRGDPRAVEELEAVVKADPDNKSHRAAAALLTLGKYYHLRGKKDYPQAERVLAELERRFPQSEPGQEAPFHRGLALHLQGRDAEARRVLDGWLDAAPKDSSRANAYAWLCFHDKLDRGRGVEVARRGLEASPKDDGLWDTLAELEFALGRAAEAREAEKRALQLKPGDAYYQAQLKRFGGPR